jgi:hypothetical protein
LGDSFPLFGVILLGLIGIGLGVLALRGTRKREGAAGGNPHRELDRLFTDIAQGLRMLSSPTRFGGMGLLREKQYEVARLLGELQRRLRHLDDRVRDRYEARAQRILEQAARFGITLPPP